jgi:hypothetical protein
VLFCYYQTNDLSVKDSKIAIICLKHTETKCYHICTACVYFTDWCIIINSSLKNGLSHTKKLKNVPWWAKQIVLNIIDQVDVYD